MPRIRRYSKRYGGFRKRRYNKRKRFVRRRRGGMMTRYVQPVVNYRKITFRYAKTIDLDGVAPAHVFSANGMKTTDITGATGAPLGFDEYCAFYLNYTVISSKITVTAINVGGTSAPVIVAVQLDKSVVPGVLMLNEIENRRITYRLISGNTAQNKVTLAKTLSTRKFFKIKDPVGNDDLSPTCS